MIVSTKMGLGKDGKEEQPHLVRFSRAGFMLGHLHPNWETFQAAVSHFLCSYSSSSQTEAPKLHFFPAPTDATFLFSAHCSFPSLPPATAEPSVST